MMRYYFLSLALATFSLALVIMINAIWPLGEEDMPGESLKPLLANGLTLMFGGPGEGYKGTLRLQADGTSVGLSVQDNGIIFDLTGTWTIEDNQFCRKWKFNNFKKKCETWRKVGDNKVVVLIDGKKIRVNSW